jgi:mono/diheme cytochrome c family protein
MNKLVFASLALIVLLSSCTRDRSKPNIQYTPDMYVSIPYNPYAINSVMSDSMAAQTPPIGAIARGKMPFVIPEGLEGYAYAKDSLQSPLDRSKSNLDKGKKSYEIYCAICHGTKGDGQGKLVTRGKFLGVPAFKDREVTDGSIYHVIYYGRNMMGSHASQLTEKERWQVVQYVQKLRNK